MDRQRLLMTVMLLALTVFTVGTRLWGIADVQTYILDESIHIPSAYSYVASGHFTPEIHWIHPPLKHILQYDSIRIFGDNPYGWRMRNALAAVLSVVMLYLLAKELFVDRRMALLAATLLAIDPVHVFFSRTTSPEVLAVLFLTVTVYATLRYVRTDSVVMLLAAGVFLGLSFSIKWYFVPAMVILLSFALYHKTVQNGQRLPDTALIISGLVALPAFVYLLPYYAWFGRGFDLSEFFRMQADAYTVNQGLTADVYTKELVYSSSALEWFTKPIIVGMRMSQGAWSSFHVFINDFPAWLAAAPTLAYTTYRSYRNRDTSLGLLSLLCLTMYLQFVLVRRPVFIYSSLPGLPLICLLISYSIVSLGGRYFDNAKYGLMAVCMVLLLWGLYLFPLITGAQVPVVLYAPLLSLGNITAP